MKKIENIYLFFAPSEFICNGFQKIPPLFIDTTHYPGQFTNKFRQHGNGINTGEHEKEIGCE